MRTMNYLATVVITCEQVEVRTLGWSDTMNAMTDHTLAQGTPPIAALRAQLGKMIPKLARAGSEASVGPTSRARGLRRDAMPLRGDVVQAHCLIGRLPRWFLGAEAVRVTPESRHADHDVAVRGGCDAPAVLG